MRDIVIVGYNNTPKTGTLNNNKTDYKSYKDFLENYGDKNSKDEVESVSSTDSGVSSSKLLDSRSNNTSTSSLNSDVNGATTVFSKVESTPTVIMGGTRTGSFRNYLDGYNNKKFSSVKPVIASKPIATTIKSEIVIQVNDPLASPKSVVIRQQSSPAFSHIPTIKPQPQSITIPHSIPPPIPIIIPASPQKPLNIPPPPPIPNPPSLNIPPPPPPIPQNIPPPPPMLGLLSCSSPSKKWATVETETCQTVSEKPKIPQGNSPAANLAKILNEHVLARRKISDAETPSPKLNEIQKASTLPRQQSPVPPKLPPSLPKARVLSPTNGVSDKSPLKQRVVSKLSASFERAQQPKETNCIDSVDYCTTTTVPITDGSATVNKGDPNVKKLVYNTYRGLLGAYNNKANDMISTLPRNMVIEDKGVTKQLESISLQCRLDKLNGRINPKLEQE